jgi:AI-2 transport protein TqsA
MRLGTGEGRRNIKVRDHAASPGPRTIRNLLLWVIAAAAGIWTLKATLSVTMPLAFAFMLVLLLFPVQRAIEKRVSRRLRWLGTASAMALLLVIAAAVVAFLSWSVASMVREVPRYEGMYQELREWVEEYGVTLPAFGRDASEENGGAEGESQTAGNLQQLASLARVLLAGFWGFAGLSILIFFFTLLMLLEADAWGRRVQPAFGRHSRMVLDVVAVMAHKIREFLWLRTLMSLLTGIAAGAWFWVLGIDFWYFWGFLAYLLNYVPFVGSILATVPPVLVALIMGAWTTALAAAAGALVINNVVGNFIEPRLEGERLSISPVVLLAGLVFWSWAWGWLGAFLAVPLTTALVVVLAHVDDLKSVALLLSQSSSVRALDRDMEV